MATAEVDGRPVAVVANDNRNLQVWDLATGHEEQASSATAGAGDTQGTTVALHPVRATAAKPTLLVNSPGLELWPSWWRVLILRTVWCGRRC